ncbi:MAG: hypothetical protein IJ329_02920 [Clostridia bacterium]|nr:hypothetical protein [Clostridia bacterium]
MGLRKMLRKPKKEKSVSSDFKKLKLLVTVVNRNKTEFFIDLIGDFDVNFQTSVSAQGTAKSETLALLGLEESDKSVIFSVIREDRAEEIMRAVDERFHKLRGGKGIAFTIPLSSVIGVAIYRFLSDNRSAT